MTTKPKFPWAFILITFAFTWLILLPGVLASRGLFKLPLPLYALVGLAQFGPSLTAFALTLHHEGKAGAGQLLKRAFNFHIPWRWLALIFVVPLAVDGVAVLLHWLTGGSLPEMPFLAQPLAILPAFISTLLMYGPLPEEFGWRGYCLGRLQAKWNALTASLVLGAIWWLWHLPGAFMEGVAQSYIPQLPYLIWCMAISVLFTWMYNHTNGNLLAALLFHTMLNLANAIFPPFAQRPGADQTAFVYVTVIYVLIAAGVTAYAGAQRLVKPAQRVLTPSA
jgi:membrane protease YdiL (CAAX protease family)